MAGMGPPPKDPAKRARSNKDVVQLRVLPALAAPKPELPDFTIQVKIDGDLVTQEFAWPVTTREWWDQLDNHPLQSEFTDMDWSYLLDTARLHAAFWQGNLSLAGELRLREAKYGFTPEDRARLRIQFAQATDAEVTTAGKVEQSSRDRNSGIKRVQ
ncbi:hypothetical protein [Plantibacter sp. YIM 135249]|uniref:phage terminase small subunit n=1 Tax=Plantibacter sp. YIM 135249 TaxID=3423918 RepID=UPI003D32689A